MTPVDRKMTLWMWSKGKNTFDIAKAFRDERKKARNLDPGPTEAEIFALITDHVTRNIAELEREGAA